MKFKVGDRVVHTMPCHFLEWPKKGAVGIVVSLEPNYTVVYFDTPFSWNGKTHHVWPCTHNSLTWFDDTVNIPALNISEVL